jgi:ATP-dependent Lon protease
MLLLRGVTIFPATTLNIEIDDEGSAAALRSAMRGSRRQIFLAFHKFDENEPFVVTPPNNQIYPVGLLGRVTQFLNSSDGVRAVIECEQRARWTKIMRRKPCFTVQYEMMFDNPVSDAAAAAELVTHTKALAGRYAMLGQGTAPDFRPHIEELLAGHTPLELAGSLADLLAHNVFIPNERKYELLSQLDPLERLKKLNDYMFEAIAFLEVDFEVRQATNIRLAEGQREGILREQLRVIKQSLGEGGETDPESEAETYREQILALAFPDDVEKKLLKDAANLRKQHNGSPDAASLTQYLDTCLNLPWTIITKERLDPGVTRKILDEDHYGLDKVKRRIVEFVAVRKLAPGNKGSILCLIGPPGTGKTSIATGIAKALNRNMARISLGGVHDEADIRGHRKTYIGAMPGRIIEAVQRAGTRNPLLLLDEVDKIGHDYRGDPAAALLEALDPEQNATFRDHYLEIPFDLSDTLFVTTANDKSAIPPALLDRMEVIDIPSYTDEEKLQIAKSHLLAKQRKKHGLKAAQIKVTDDAIRLLITDYTRESGVRVLERELAGVCRRAAVAIAEGTSKRVTVKADNLADFAGTPKYKRDPEDKQASVGVAHGLAWTSIGGEVLDVEVNVLEGNGKLELTGNLGQVMQESAKAAVSYIRSRAKEIGVDPKFYKTKDIHIHFPEGATPKDGPSAGITVTLATISALKNTPLRGDIAMTGEVTLRGRVLPIGGLREKTMAALRADIHTLIIPEANKPDLDEIDPLVRAQLEFYPTNSVDGVLDFAMA